MKHVKHLWLVALLAPVVGLAAPEIFKWQLPNGEIVYSDKPPTPDAVPLELSPLQIYSAPPIPSLPQAPKEKEPFEYEEFRITQPADDEVIRDNGGGNVSIRATLTPGLQRGHVLDLVLNGKAVGSGRSTSVTLTNVDRGSHGVHAVIKDEQGQEVARTAPITFHLLRVRAP